MRTKDRAIAIIAAIMLVTGCTNDDQTIKTLEDAGYTEVQPGGYALFQCSKDDTVKTSFRARNSKGKMVEGVVCCGLIMKSCTIRH